MNYCSSIYQVRSSSGIVSLIVHDRLIHSFLAVLGKCINTISWFICATPLSIIKCLLLQTQHMYIIYQAHNVSTTFTRCTIPELNKTGNLCTMYCSLPPNCCFSNYEHKNYAFINIRTGKITRTKKCILKLFTLYNVAVLIITQLRRICLYFLNNFQKHPRFNIFTRP